jgi:hypothetical protein
MALHGSWRGRRDFDMRWSPSIPEHITQDIENEIFDIIAPYLLRNLEEYDLGMLIDFVDIQFGEFST